MEFREVLLAGDTVTLPIKVVPLLLVLGRDCRPLLGQDGRPLLGQDGRPLLW